MGFSFYEKKVSKKSFILDFTQIRIIITNTLNNLCIVIQFEFQIFDKLIILFCETLFL